MTEADWLTCTDSQAMLEFLRDKASERKARQFAVACCRSLWHRMGEPLRRVVEVGERYADGLVSRDEADAAAGLAIEQGGESDPFSMAAWNTVALCSEPDDPFNIGSDAAAEANAVVDGRLAQCHLLRCLFGPLPFSPVAPAPDWLTWQDGTIPQIAQAIYDDRAFDRLPLLADALEEAGCHHADILSHCRGPGPHTRGCWVLDLILARA